MGAKTFVNNTGYDLSVMLTVREGSKPGTDTQPVNFSLSRGESRYVDYGPQPYLDGIAINAVGLGNIVAAQEFVITRGSAIDNDFNTHDYVFFSVKDDSLVLSFGNG